MPIRDLQPHDVRDFINDEWDCVITVCDHARETCPVFAGKVKRACIRTQVRPVHHSRIADNTCHTLLIPR